MSQVSKAGFSLISVGMVMDNAKYRGSLSECWEEEQTLAKKKSYKSNFSIK